MFRWLVALCCAGLTLAPGAAARPDPLDPKAEVPPQRPPTALRQYRPATTPEPGGWREANDRVARIGGWRTYLREAHAADAPASAPAAAPAPAGAASAPPMRHREHGQAHREHRHGHP